MSRIGEKSPVASDLTQELSPEFPGRNQKQKCGIAITIDIYIYICFIKAARSKTKI